MGWLFYLKKYNTYQQKNIIKKNGYMNRATEEDVLLVINFLKSLGYQIPISDERVVYSRLMDKLNDMDYSNDEEGWESIIAEYEDEIISPQRSLRAYENFN